MPHRHEFPNQIDAKHTSGTDDVFFGRDRGKGRGLCHIRHKVTLYFVIKTYDTPTPQRLEDFVLCSTHNSPLGLSTICHGQGNCVFCLEVQAKYTSWCVGQTMCILLGGPSKIHKLVCWTDHVYFARRSRQNTQLV
jgi:hypothetical protein